jgi:site-specific DNA-cytosine methylase
MTPGSYELAVVELYAGAGGLAIGLHQAGIKHRALIERDPPAALTMREKAFQVLDIPRESVVEKEVEGADFPWITIREAMGSMPCAVPRGGDPAIPNYIQYPGAKVYPGHSGSYCDLPAKRLKAGAHRTFGGENIVLDPSTPRPCYFSIREPARIQTFPDKWIFHGSWCATIRHHGNAVPAVLARLFGLQILGRLGYEDVADAAPHAITVSTVVRLPCV